MAAMSTNNAANFTTGTNLGAQIAQNFGLVNSGAVHFHVQQHPAEELGEDVHLSTAAAKEKCHQLFRLTASANGEGYEWYKSRIEERVPGTCEWFIRHKNYRSWKQSSSGILLVSADPGCGKSVLSKFLIEKELSKPVCYFFFKDQDQCTLKQALCGLLHQIFDQYPALIDFALPEFRKNGSKLVNITNSLWVILQRAISSLDEITFVLDGLDECREDDLKDLISKLKRQFPQRGECSGRGKFLLSTRPYQDIISEFWGLVNIFPGIRIPGEKYSKQIGTEVDIVVNHRVQQLAQKQNLKADLQEHLERRLAEIPHRTYLWVYLVFEHLNKAGFTKTRRGIEKAIKTLPEDVNEAYEKILEKSKDDHFVRNVLSMVLGAARPLTLTELNIAVTIQPGFSSLKDLDFEEELDFQQTVRDRCGLFISIQDGKVYLLHQTAREFLISKATPSSTAQPGRWCGSIGLQQAHSALANNCLTFLNFKEWWEDSLLAKDNSAISDSSDSESSNPDSEYPLVLLEHREFLRYAAFNWPAHIQAVGLELEHETMSLALELLSRSAAGTPVWYQGHQIRASQRDQPRMPVDLIPLTVASWLRLDALVQHLCHTEDVGQRDRLGKTALHYAADSGGDSTCQILLASGANIDCQDEDGQSPILLASKSSCTAVLERLIDLGAQVNLHDCNKATALHHAASRSNETVLKLLLKHGANAKLRDKSGKTALHHAVIHGDETIINVLLREPEVEIDAEDWDRRTALYYATTSNKETLVRLLLRFNADTNVADSSGRTVLHWAADNGNDVLVSMLIDGGASIDEADGGDCAVLSYAVGMENLSMTQLLLDKGANPDRSDLNGRTVLHQATINNDEDIVRLLLDAGADTYSQDRFGVTALHSAVEAQNDEIIRLLIEAGASSDVPDNKERTAVDYALGGRDLRKMAAIGLDHILQLLVGGDMDMLPDLDEDGVSYRMREYWGYTDYMVAKQEDYDDYLAQKYAAGEMYAEDYQEQFEAWKADQQKLADYEEDLAETERRYEEHDDYCRAKYEST